MPQSVVSLPICSSRTNSVKTSGMTILESLLVSFFVFTLHSNLLTLLIGQVGKVLGERWKALSDKQRQPYEAKAAADKKRYEDEKAAYNVSDPLEL